MKVILLLVLSLMIPWVWNRSLQPGCGKCEKYQFCNDRVNQPKCENCDDFDNICDIPSVNCTEFCEKTHISPVYIALVTAGIVIMVVVVVLLCLKYKVRMKKIFTGRPHKIMQRTNNPPHAEELPLQDIGQLAADGRDQFRGVQDVQPHSAPCNETLTQDALDQQRQGQQQAEA